MDEKSRQARRPVGRDTTDATVVTGGDQRQASAAMEILQQLRRLRALAAENDLNMIVYLLDMVALEAEDSLARSGAKPETP